MQCSEKDALELLSNLAYEKFEEKDYISAIIYCNRYIEIDQTNPIIYNTLGYIYKKISKYENIEKQISLFEKALELDSEYIVAIRNLALAYPLAGRYQEAVKCFQKLFELAPVMDDYLAYAYLKIKLKDFDEGWKYYQYRFIRENCIGYPQMDKPEWKSENISDKTLLVHFEQGFGDSIMFFRYLEQAKTYAKKIIFRVQDEIADLIKINLKNIEVVGVSTPLEELNFDYHIPLINLLNVMPTSADNIPFSAGYIKADENKIEQFKNRFFDNDCLKIGISYNGTQLGNRLRNVPLECFYPLSKIKNVKVYSFQKGFGAKQIENMPSDIEIVDLGKEFNDFSDTAAAMANIDLFITSDNSVFNLAGAMGAKTLVLLNKDSEWRWFLDEETTPWYDSVRIFKKKDENEDWNVLMQEISDIVAKEANLK